MGPSERAAVGGLLTAALLLAPGFLVHEAPRFAGSLPGGLLGIAAALLFTLLLLHSVAKRAAWARRAGLRPSATLAFHAYAGAAGAVLAVLHVGHSYRSLLGIALALSVAAAVATGFVGRHYLARVGRELAEQRAELAALRARLSTLARQPGEGAALRHVAGAVTDLERAIAGRDTLKRLLSGWVAVHVAASLLVYALLALHVWSGVYFGLRWL